MISLRSLMLAGFGISLLGSMVGVVAHPEAKKCPYVIELEKKLETLEKKVALLESRATVKTARKGGDAQARGPRGRVNPKKDAPRH
jgi:hypothetical protein